MSNSNIPNQPQNVEDDAPIDVEQVLSTRTTLSDGSESYLFSRGPKYSDELWPIQCHLCRVGYMVNEKKLRSHLKSEKHLSNLKAGPPDATEFLTPYDQLYSDRLHLVNPITIYPGEIIYEVTTFMAERLIKIKPYNWDVPPKPDILKILNKDPIYDYNATAPVIGICYMFKYITNNLVTYRCTLCEAVLYEDDCYQHLISASHINLYIEEHFSCIKKTLNGMLGLVSQEIKSKYIVEVIRYIYHKLEAWKGRREFNLIDAKAIEHQYPRFLARIKKIIHYDENVVKFSDDELNKFLQTLRSGQELLPPPLDKLPNQKTKEEIQTIKDQNSNKRKFNNCPETLARVKRDKRTADKISSLGLDDSLENWDRYRDLLKKTLFDLNKEYGQFMDMSERHPRYAEEWNRFWIMKCDELRLDNIDPTRYNFTNEWNRYWISYMEDCYEKDVERCKFELRKKMKLPFRPRTPSPVRQNTVNTDRSSNDNSGGNTSSIPSLLSLPPILGGFNNQQQPLPLYGGTGTNSNNIGDIVGGIGMMPDLKPSEPLSVLSVLRLLTALEDQLGSLGPTAIQLLSKAIFFEKDSKNSNANELLNETEYFSLFVTSLEKLKGQLMANIVPDLKLIAVRKAVHDLDQILTLFEEYKYKRRNNVKPEVLVKNEPEIKYPQNDRFASANDNWPNEAAANSNRNWNNQNNRRVGNRSNRNGGRNNRGRNIRWNDVQSNDIDNFKGPIPGTITPLIGSSYGYQKSGNLSNSSNYGSNSSQNYGGSSGQGYGGSSGQGYGGNLGQGYGNYGGNY